MSKNIVFETIRSLTGSRNVIVLNTSLIQFCGYCYKTSAFLSQVIYWSDRGSLSDGWIAKSSKDWYNELFLSDYEIRKASRFLQAYGLETKLQKWKGAPVVHYRLNPDLFYNAWSAFLIERETEQISDIENISETETSPETDIKKTSISESEQISDIENISETIIKTFENGSLKVLIMDSENISETYTELTSEPTAEPTAETTVEPAGSPASEILEPEVEEVSDPDDVTAKGKKRKEKNSGKKEKKDNFPEFTFSDFWDLYNKKIGIDRARPLWDKLSKEEKLQVLTHLADFLPATEKDNRRFRPNPVNYLRDKYFNDEIIAISQNGSKPNQQQNARRDERRISTSAAIASLID